MKKMKNISEQNKINLNKVGRIIEKHKDGPGEIVDILQDIQACFNFLPREALQLVSQKRKVPINRIYHTATFYSAFSLTPRGKYTISVCTGTACHVRGAPLLLEAIQRELGIGIGETTDDRLFSLEAVRCIGACSIAPAVRINNKAFGPLDSASLSKLLKKYRKK
jgi:NADH:ubiquinone oxidoreductase subunit E